MHSGMYLPVEFISIVDIKDSPARNSLSFVSCACNGSVRSCCAWILGSITCGEQHHLVSSKFADEIKHELKHTGVGIISMANAGPNMNGSQFFITLAPHRSLDDGVSCLLRYISTDGPSPGKNSLWNPCIMIHLNLWWRQREVGEEKGGQWWAARDGGSRGSGVHWLEGGVRIGVESQGGAARRRRRRDGRTPWLASPD
ncbi:uncharacterized protein [Elaeis guineensis]|uniref:uncharacterized protein isoform X6 n=1 Tax=Elaeis guineensis var. tenera TaxID=51953 RepID=UPI003C6D19BF